MKRIVFIVLLSIAPLWAWAQYNNIKIDYSSPKEYEIGGINVVGAKFLDRNSLISIAGFRVGEKIRIPGDDISQAVRKLWKQGILGDIKISVTEIRDNKVFLQIELKERPRFSRIIFEGIPKGQQQTLEDKIKLIRGRVVTDALLKNTKNTLRNHYVEKGFKNVDVNIVQQKDTILSNSVVLRIDIDRNSKVKINEIKFKGISAFEEKKLKKKMKKTKQKRFLRIFNPSKFIPAEFANDKQKLIDFYNESGYRNASIVSDTVYDYDDKTVNIEIEIEEGKKFYYRDIEWTGNYKYTDEQLSTVLGIGRGDVYNPKELNERLNFSPQSTDVTSLYMDDGYLFFSVEPVEVLVEEDSIDIEMRMFEGEQATISKVIVNGNTQTNDHVIFRELRTIPGQKFSRTDLIRTQRELAQLGYFDPETIEINPKPNYANSTVDIEYTVTERPNDQIELSGGWGGQFGFVGTLGLVFNNFSLRRVTDFNYWKPLPKGDGQRLNLRLQANGRQFQTYTVTFTEPWLGGRKPNSLTLNLNHSVNRRLDFFSRSREVLGSLKINGATLSLGRRLPWPDDFFTMSNSLSFLVYDLDNFNVFGGGFNNGTSYNFTFNTTLARNSVDNPTFPRGGSNISLSASFTPPYSRFSSKTLAETDPTEQFRLVEYHKWMFDNSWFLSLAGNLVLNARVNMGFIGRYTPSRELGPFERFVLGGDGLQQNGFLIGRDIIGLRGYQNGSIVPPETGGNGGIIYNKFVMELRYPVSLNPSATIYLLSFVEGGNNWGNFDEYNPFKVRRSAGVGARIFMPAFGLLGVDWGYGFDEIEGNPDANGAQFHFTIGQQFR